MANKGNALVARWHRIYMEVWGGATESTGFHKHPLIRHLPLYDTPTKDINYRKMTVLGTTIMDYGAHVLCLERLRDLIDPSDGFIGREYFLHRMFLLPGLKEIWLYQTRTKFNGEKQFELLTTRYDMPESETDDMYYEAKDFVEDMLENTLMMKFSHGLDGVMESHLADILENEKNWQANHEEHTFMDYLRYGF